MMINYNDIKKIAVLGSTGSIGRQTLDVAEQHGIPVIALTANENVPLLEEQVRRFRPKLAVMASESAARELAVRLSDTKTKVLGGINALCDAVTLPEVDTVVTAVVGMIGLKPTLAAIQEQKRIGLANKETLVCAGELVMNAAKKNHAEIIPVDSEHAAIFQCLQGCRDSKEIKRLILTCSGGPFYNMTPDAISKMKRVDALKHPNWTMGPKITIDCATLMNKGLEVIEAMRMYNLPLKQVDVVIHRQSMIHSMVEFRDGAILAQLGVPDMRLPIQYALTYPERIKSPVEPLDLLSCPPLTFAKPDRDRFPCLSLAEEAAQDGGTACAILNAANEEAVQLFLKDQIAFYKIPELIKETRLAVPAVQTESLDEILEADAAARRFVLEHWK